MTVKKEREREKEKEKCKQPTKLAFPPWIYACIFLRVLSA
jgi:hypothetical protein